MARAPKCLFVGFHTPLNQRAVLEALDERERIDGQPMSVGLASRMDFLGPRAKVYVPTDDGMRERGFAQSREWPFPSREVLERLGVAETVAARMMARVHRVSGAGRTFERRKRRWLEWVVWSYGFLAHHGFERLVFCNVPHFPFDYVLHETARAMGLETRFLMQLQVKDTFLLADSIDGLFDALAQRLAEPESAPPPALERRMQLEFDRRSGRHVPFYMHGGGLPWSRRFHTWQRRLLRMHLRAAPTTLAYGHARLTRPLPPLDASAYVYVPLQLQPEASTLPLGGVHVDQLLMIEMLARALPAGWLLIVKENPKQRFDKRHASFYRRLRELPQVRLASRSTSSFDLLHAARAVATVTGSAGWEAVFARKPVFAFGNSFYRRAPGVHAVEALDDLAAALARVQAGSFACATNEQIEHFLRALQSTTYAGVSDIQYLRDSEYDLARAAAACSRAVAAAIAPAPPATPSALDPVGSRA